MIQYLHDQTGVRAGAVTTEEQAARSSGTKQSIGKREVSDRRHAALDQERHADRLSRLGDRRDRIAPRWRSATAWASSTNSSPARSRSSLNGMLLADAILLVVVVIGMLFLIIEAVALIMGLALARSITSSVHELFMGTERVRQGDFTHRINIQSHDQLGELADSFNQMTGSIENLLQTAAEKKRLEEELRIARQIQMSLLPRGLARVSGHLGHRAVRPRARGRRRLLRLLSVWATTPRRADCRRVGQGDVGRALHGRAQGPGAVAQPDLPVAATAADGGQPDHLGEPRHAQLHHDDLRRARSRAGHDDVRARRAHAV